MKRQRNKYIEVRIPHKYKDVFYQKRELIKLEIDKLLNQQEKFNIIEKQEVYDGKVFFTIDDLYYQKLEELAKKYNTKIPRLIRSLFFKVI
jgi:hypothetical protein